MYTKIKAFMFGVFTLGIACHSMAAIEDVPKPPLLEKVKDIVIYYDDQFYSAFPSVIKKKDGELYLAFRRAPNRQIFGESHSNHVDPNSYLVAVRSKDGYNWTKEPELLYAHAFGGSQDPCLLQLRNGDILCASYGWAFLREDQRKVDELSKQKEFKSGNATFLGGYYLRSTDGAKSWKGPYYPPKVPQELNISPTGQPIPAYNRGALWEGKSGRLYWVVAAHIAQNPGRTGNFLVVSDDQGKSWRYESVVATDEKVAFNEASVYETPKGDIVAFLRTANYDDQACIARSTDGGKTFQTWKSMGFKGHPLQALRLPDQRVLLVYGYRHKPFGIRARLLNAECTDFDTAEEIVLREDGGSGDIGYPWAVQLDNNQVLITYYYNIENGTRHIAGTIVKVNK